MENHQGNFFLTVPEPYQSALLYIRQFFIEEMGLQERWKFNTPFYYYEEKWFGYLSYNKKRNHEIYIGFIKGYKINHAKLLSEGRKQVKVYRIDATKDINATELTKIVLLLKAQY